MRVALLVLAALAAAALVLVAAFVIRDIRRSGWAVFKERMRRSAKIRRLAIRRGLRFVFLRRRVRRSERSDPATGNGGGAGAGQADLDAFHLETAEQVFELMGGMKGAIMKLGQMASILGDSLPEQYSQALQGLQQSAPPMTYELAAGVVEEELGRSPDRVFAEFSPEPVAAASIGQVHRARLEDGTEVAVKVQYPGVDVAIRADLDNMYLLTSAARMMAPGIDPDALVGELKARMLDELDYRKEAANQAEFAAAYDGHPWIRIPQVFPEFSGARVITSQWVSGRSFYDVLDSGPEERNRAGEQLFRFFVGSVGPLRFFNADPHPGNYFFAEDGAIWFLDFGMVKRFGPEIPERLREQIEALRSGDPNRLRDAMVSHGWFPPDLDLDMERVFELALLTQRPLTGPDPFRFTREHSRAAVEAAMSIQGPYGDIIKRMTLPADHVMLNRIQFGVMALLGRLEADGPWAAVFDEYFMDGPPATELGRAAAGFPRPARVQAQ